jgi:hypothetical protein
VVRLGFHNIYIMNIDAIFPFATVYNVYKLDVVQGQRFTLRASSPGRKKWFSDSDDVLSITERGKSADIEAANIGVSDLIVKHSASGATLAVLVIRVVAAVVDPAATLGLSTDAPVLKT